MTTQSKSKVKRNAILKQVLGFPYFCPIRPQGVHAQAFCFVSFFSTTRQKDYGRRPDLCTSLLTKHAPTLGVL